MIDISVQNIVKAFEEGNNILDGVSFEVYEGEHIGLLGKNGAGKTTLFRILCGELSSDEGDVVLAGGKRLGMISQIPVYPEEYTTEDVLCTAFAPLYAMERRLAELTEQMSAGQSDPRLLAEYDEVSARYEREGGYTMQTELNRVVNGLEIPAEQRQQRFATLSGGEKTRVNLARLILEDTDILLLDEPTNHLDMKATQWLEEYLEKYKGTVLIISHDRYFLDRCVTRTVELSGGKAEFYPGNYSFYVAEKQRRMEEQQQKYEREQAEIERLQKAADRLHQWGTGNQRLMKKSQAIESRIEKMDRTERPRWERAMKVRFGEKDFSGDEVLLMRGVSKAYDGAEPLFEIPELLVEAGERIALIGENGTGKSTLVKLIMEQLPPDRGVLRMGPQVKTAYLPQIVEFSHPERSMLETLLYEDNCSPQSARNRLGAFKFSGEDVFKPVAALSGGERSRLKLCMLMKSDINLLILDEPTNHLDIASREWIEEALGDYGGTLLFVSHDRYFINRFATRIWLLEDGQLRDYRCGFEKFNALRAMEEKRPEPDKSVRKSKGDTREKRRSGGANPRLAEKLEKQIAALEKQLGEIGAQREEFSSDYEKLMELDERAEALNAQLDELMERWSEASQ